MKTHVIAEGASKQHRGEFVSFDVRHFSVLPIRSAIDSAASPIL